MLYKIKIKIKIKNRLFNVCQQILDNTIQSKGLTILPTRFVITIIISHAKSKLSQFIKANSHNKSQRTSLLPHFIDPREINTSSLIFSRQTFTFILEILSLMYLDSDSIHDY